MINLLLAAAISCTATLPAGNHSLECTAYYQHDNYQSTKTHVFWMPIPMDAECSGEGHPFKVSMKNNGVDVCHNETPLFANGFESGDTGAWSYVTPE